MTEPVALHKAGLVPGLQHGPGWEGREMPGTGQALTPSPPAQEQIMRFSGISGVVLLTDVCVQQNVVTLKALEGSAQAVGLGLLQMASAAGVFLGEL